MDNTAVVQTTQKRNEVDVMMDLSSSLDEVLNDGFYPFEEVEGTSF